MSITFTKHLLDLLPPEKRKLFQEPQEQQQNNVFRLNIKPKVNAVAGVINPGEPGHVPGNKNNG